MRLVPVRGPQDAQFTAARDPRAVFQTLPLTRANAAVDGN